MAYNALNNLIDAYIYANGVQAITGQILNGVLKQMVSQLGSGYHLMGVAGPETVPASNDYAMAYFAATAGEYTDFGGITLAAGEVAVLLTYGNGSWSKQTIYNVPTGTADLENTANFITNAVTDLANYYTKTEVDTTLADYPTLEALATALADYYTKTEVDTTLADYATKDGVDETLEDYYTKDEVDAELADRYTKQETDTKLEDYYKKTETYDKDEVDSIVAALSRQEYIVAWDGLAAPDVSAIPAGVTVTYSGTTYTGTLAASASTVNKIYMVWNGVAYDMYGTSQDGGYSWVPMGTTSVDLSQYATKAEVSQLQQEVTAEISQLEAEMNENNFGDTLASVSGNPSGSIGVDFENGLKYYVAFTVTNSTTFDITLRSADGSAGPIVQTVAASKTYAPGDYIVPFVCGVTTAKYIRFGNSSVWANITSVGVYNTLKESTVAPFTEFSEKLLQARQAIYLCTIKSAGGRAVSSITKNGAAVSLVFGGDLVVYGRKTTGNTGNAYISLSTNGVTYNFASNLDGLFLDLINQTLTIANCASVYGLETALNSPDKVLLAVNMWGQLISPVATLQSEFDAIQFADDTAITENTPNNYTTRIVKGGVTHEVANGNVSNYFKSGSATFGLFEKTGTASASQVVGMPVSEGGKLASVYLNNAESATINIKIYNADFSAVRKTISKSVTSGENTLTLNEDIAAGENIVLEGAKPYFANDSSFEQIFWYNYGGSTGWALRSDHIKWSAGYTIVSDSIFDTLSNKVDELENKEEDLEDRVDALEQNIEYVTVTVQRNAADFNSIRETIAGITDASYYKRYIVKVPEGRWFECDINGKDYVTIQGVEASRTILYCDGTSDKVTPDDYSFDTYAGQSLSSINQAYKHIINVLHNIDVRGLTLEVNDCKYCAHIDKTSFKTASFKNVFFHEMNANVTFTIGIGSHAGQEITFEGCDFKAYDTHTICAYVHNWNNLTAINTITFRDCQFNKSFMRYDELGSDYTTFVNLLNCYSKAETPQLVFQTVTTGGHSHWINPDTGEPITDMTQLPYCTHINIIGSNVASIYQDGTRPDIADYIIGRIG